MCSSDLDEAQFFDPELPNVCDQLALRGARVIIAGLDMDFKGQPFGIMPALLAKADYITKLHDANRGWCSSQDQVHATIVDFYQILFTSGSLHGFEKVIKNVSQVVTEEMNDMLMAEVTIEEVEIALK